MSKYTSLDGYWSVCPKVNLEALSSKSKCLFKLEGIILYFSQLHDHGVASSLQVQVSINLLFTGAKAEVKVFDHFICQSVMIC